MKSPERRIRELERRVKELEGKAPIVIIPAAPYYPLPIYPQAPPWYYPTIRYTAGTSTCNFTDPIMGGEIR